MKVRLNNQKSIGFIARLEAFLAGTILTVSTAYAATVCPLYLTQWELEAELQSRLAAAQGPALPPSGSEMERDPHLRELAQGSADYAEQPAGRIDARTTRVQ